MTGRQPLDYLIIGQGLAGSALALQLLCRRKKILVVDRGDENTSSRVAAGLFNPVTGKKMGKTWLADALFPYLRDFYRRAETLTGSTFLVEKPIYRPFINVAEQHDWMGAAAGPEGAFLREVQLSPRYPEQLNDPLGGILLDGSGYLDTTKYLDGVRSLLLEKGAFEASVLETGQLTFHGTIAYYRGVQVGKVVFCEGVAVNANPLFNWLPVRGLKGEILCVKGKFLDDALVNRGIYVIPAGQDEWRVGATYERAFEDGGITASGREALTNRLQSLARVAFTTTGQLSGIRPTTPDRRPILGPHPEIPGALIFNGLGTKGVSLSPYFSEVLVNWMENAIPLMKEVDVNRYYSLYWNSR